MTNERFDDFKIDEDYLAHHGILNMKWGVHNDETKRKYGELPGLREARKLNAPSSESTSSSKPANPKAKPSLAERGIAAVKQKRQEKKDAKEAERQKSIDEWNEHKRREAEDAEYQKKYGMSKEKYEALREATLRSHDPRVVAKGMRVLTDEELAAKIQRLEQEGKVRSAAAKARKEAAEARQAELNQKKQTLPYQLGSTAAKSVTNVVVNAATQKALKPVAEAVLSSVGKSGVKALESLKKHTKEEAPKVKEAVKDTAATVKSEAATGKAQTEAARAKTKAAQAEKKTASKPRTKSEVEAGFGETLYNRMKAEATKSTNREGIDADDPTLKLNRNTAPKVAAPEDDKDK